MAKYEITKRVVNMELVDVILREKDGKETFIVLKDIDRAKQIDQIEDEDAKQMKLQTLFLYRLAVGDKELTEAGEEYQSEFEMPN